MSDSPRDPKPGTSPSSAAASKSATSGGFTRAPPRASSRPPAQFEAEIWVRKNGTSVSGRSIMGLMMLAAAAGTSSRSPRPAPMPRRRWTTLARLIECKFDED